MSKRVLVNVLLFVAGIYILLLITDKIFTRQLQGSNYYKFWWSEKIQNTSFDFVILGNSRAYMTVDADSMGKILNRKGINLSVDGSNAVTHPMLLKSFIANGNSIKTVYYQLDYYTFNNIPADNFSVYQYLPYIDKKEVFDYLQQTHGWKAFYWKYVPLSKYAAYNFKIGLEEIFKTHSVSHHHPFDEKGSYLIDHDYTTKKAENVFNAENDNAGTDLEISYTQPVEELIKICKSNKIQLVFFTSPYLPEYRDEFKNINRFEEEVDSIAIQSNIKWLNYSNDSTLRNKNYFCDSKHLNKKGAEIFTAQLASSTIAD